jgi:hypothetical protein
MRQHPGGVHVERLVLQFIKRRGRIYDCDAHDRLPHLER